MKEVTDFQDLHLKYVLGETLLPEELQALQHWYTLQDSQEMSILLSETVPPLSGEAIQQRVDQLFEQIAQEMEQIRKLTRENQEIKVANEVLRAQLIQTAA